MTSFHKSDVRPAHLKPARLLSIRRISSVTATRPLDIGGRYT